MSQSPHPYAEFFRRMRFPLTVLSLLVTVNLLVLAVSVAPWARNLFWGYLADPVLFFLNAFPLALFFLFLWALIGRFRPTAIVFVFLSLLLAAISCLKLLFRAEGLVYSDFTLLPELLRILPGYTLDFGLFRALALVLALFTVLGLLILLSRRLPKHCLTLPLRFFLLLLSIALFIGSLAGPFRDNEIFENHSANWEDYALWIPFDSYRAHGFPYSFMWESRYLPENLYLPDSQEANELLAPYSDQDIPSEEKVDFIIYQVESFKDYSRHHKDIPWDKDPYAPWHRLQEQSISGSMLSRVYGGGTIEMETSLLGGHIRKPIYDRPRQSLVSYFKSQGYHCRAGHPNHDVFYSRGRIYKSLGFDRFYSADDPFILPDEGFYSDQALVKDTMRLYRENSEQGQPQFLFMVGIDNHGPYPTEEATNVPSYLSDPTADPVDIDSLNLYLEGIEKAGQAMLELAKEIEKEDRPIVFIAYGDHSPALSDVQMSLLGFDQELSDNDNFRLRYEVPWLLFANDAAKEVLRINDDVNRLSLEPAFFIPQLFDLFHWSGSPRMQFNQDFAQKIPAFRENRIFTARDSREILPQDQKHIDELMTLDLYERRQVLED